MTAPKHEIVHKRIQNPHASAPLIIPILVLCNTPDEVLERNIRANSERDLEWVKAEAAHDGVAIMVGGGPSLAETVEEIRWLKQQGGTIFAINAASEWLRARGIVPDYQVIADAKPETATLVDIFAKEHLFASQVDEATIKRVKKPKLWHLEIGDAPDGIERFFPAWRVARGGYALIGGGAATGNSALCVAYTMGFRTMHIFGYDSCHRAGRSHCYAQPMNMLIPTVDVEWAGRTFTASVAMKSQAEKFQMTAQALKQEGCTLHVYGDGLLQHMYTTKPANLTERDKYRLLWQFDRYREVAPGQLLVDAFVETAKPDGLVIDFGCGTGRAAIDLHNRGVPVYLIDFADNCRDDEALTLPFLEWDLAHPMPARGRYGFCTDVMEHIPPQQTRQVIANIFEAAPAVFFGIDTEPDIQGASIGHALHINLRPHEEWRELLAAHGEIQMEQKHGGYSVFYVVRNEA